MSVDFAYLGLAEAAELIRGKKLSPVEYATALLARIERHDPKLNAFIALMPERALAAARAAEAEITADRWRGPFHGLPYALKDIIDVEGIATTAHSRVLANNSARSHAAVTERLKAAGGILLGKLSTHEFAIGGPSFDLPWPPSMPRSDCLPRRVRRPPKSPYRHCRISAPAARLSSPPKPMPCTSDG